MRLSIKAVLLYTILSVLLSAGPALCQFWPMFHESERRHGYADLVTNLNALMPADVSYSRPNMGLVWTFPMPPKGTDADRTVDNNAPLVGAFNATANWKTDPPTPPAVPGIPARSDFFGADYRWIEGTATASATIDTADVAEWTFPDSLTAGTYRVFAWFPSSPDDVGVAPALVTRNTYPNTTTAEYVIESDDGRDVIHVNQINGGGWVQVGSTSFSFSPGMGQRVFLTSRIEDFDPNIHKIVCADAVMFVPVAAQTISSSPAAGIYDPTALQAAPSPGYEIGWGTIPVAYIGTVDKPTWATGLGLSYGSIYCVNSDTQVRNGALGTKWYAGTAVWQYPNPDPDKRKDLEGPIPDGVLSSPALADLGTAGLPDRRVYVTANDRQVYCLNAYKGELIWRGPGATVSEPAPDPTPGAVWTEVLGSTRAHKDTFGPRFLQASALQWNGVDKSALVGVTWDCPFSFDLFADVPAPPPAIEVDGVGRAYAIYAWIPGAKGVESRVRDACYEVTFESQAGTVATQLVFLNQNRGTVGSVSNTAGRWAKIGTSFWNVDKVRLLNGTKNPLDIGKPAVADAMMFLPEKVEPFSYSSPVIDTAGGQYVYVGSQNGRVYALDSLGRGAPINDGTTQEKWVYPAVRHDRVPTPSQNDRPPLGPIVASPATKNGAMYVPSLNGRVYRLSPIIGSGPNPANEDDVQAWPDARSFPKSGFSSSPAIDPATDDVYVASTDGQLFRLQHNIVISPGPDTLTQVWQFPASAADGIIGAFRFSSPAIFEKPTRNFIIIGSSDGHVYAIDKDTGLGGWKGTDDLLNPISGPEGTSQLLSSPIQSSCAIDGSATGIGNGPPGETIFVGTTDGSVRWLSADTGGFAPWTGKKIGDFVFSSPAVAQFPGSISYMYVGSDDGRLYAFSSSVNSGAWTGTGEGIPEPYGSGDIPQPDPTSGVQAQIVDKKTYDAIKADLDFTLTTNPLLTLVKDKRDDTEAPLGHAIGASLRINNEVIYEWGDKIYVVVWNLNKKADMTGVNVDIFSSSRTGDAANPGSGGAESGSKPPTKPASLERDYQAVDLNGQPITKSYATCYFDIPGSWIQGGGQGSRPPGAGSAWVISVTAMVKAGSVRNPVTGAVSPSGAAASLPGLVPELTNGKPKTKTLGGTKVYTQQYVSINNPLAIMAGTTYLAWPMNPNSQPNAIDSGGLARVNGNGALGVANPANIPVINLGEVNHGANSIMAQLGVIDRSKMGLAGQSLNKFKVDTADLYWRGGAAAVYNPLPWDWPPTETFGNELSLFSGLTSAYVGSQIDYPDIRQRYESFRKMSDGANPAAGPTILQPCVDATPSAGAQRWKLIPDPLEVYVDVPMFQPANDNGYTASMEAYLDMTGNGRFDDGNFVNGQPTAYIEPYRPFNMKLTVPPDYRIRVEESIIDLGKTPHGLGMQYPVSFANRPWTPFDDSTLYPWSVPWYHQFTVKNLGNVNLKDLRIGARSAPNDPPTAWPLVSAQSGIPLSQWYINSSLDRVYDAALKADLRLPGDPGVGHTISKARVGDTEPTSLTVPDRRREVPAYPDPMRPQIGLQVPLTQPIGTYAQYIPISAVVEGPQTGPNAGKTAMVYANPTFVLKATVREDRLTDGATNGAQPQIDVATATSLPSSDVQPAAFQDKGGNAHLFWSSNRPDPPTVPNPNDPWYIFKAVLPYDAGDWRLGVGDPSPPNQWQWWQVTPGRLPDFSPSAPPGWPQNPATPGMVVPGVSGNVLENTIKHLSPSVAQDPQTGKTWMLWQGQVYRDAGNGRTNQENRVFYTDVTDGKTTNPVYSFSKDFSMIKYGPRGLAYASGSNQWLWAFYYGGDAGKWGIFYNATGDPTDPSKWSEDAKLSTPPSLASVSEPMAVKRTINGDLYFDVTYTGLSKEGQNSDIYLSRYSVRNSQLRAATLPRVRNEVMQRDANRSTYTSRHIWWLKPTLDPAELLRPIIMARYGDAVLDVVDLTEPKYADLSEDKATGLSVIQYSSPDDTAAQTKWGTVSEPLLSKLRARYADFRQTIIDSGAGTIRFGKPVNPRYAVKISYTPRAMRLSAAATVDPNATWPAYDEPGDPGSSSDPTATMQTLRWGGNADSDTSAFSILEKTLDTAFSIGGTGGKAASALPVDRLWVFWRKPASGVRATTVFYKTFRLGVELSRSISYDETKLTQDDPSLGGVSVAGNSGNYEVDWRRGRIYFTELDERYLMPGVTPPPITVSYDGINPANQSVAARTDTFKTISWVPELEETALLGNASEAMVNEGQVCAFSQPYEFAVPGTDAKYPLGSYAGKMWVFWMSTRTGLTDLFYETVSPVFRQ